MVTGMTPGEMCDSLASQSPGGFPFGVTWSLVTGSRAQPDEAIPAKSGHRVKSTALLGPSRPTALQGSRSRPLFDKKSIGKPTMSIVNAPSRGIYLDVWGIAGH